MNNIKDKTPCEKCSVMKCRSLSKDCYGIKEAATEIYQDSPTSATASAASKLIDNGRAGTLSRVEEVIQYCLTREYKRIGIAYCFGLNNIAKEFTSILKENGLEVLPVVCTAGGVKEKEIDASKQVETISCNPAGQALVMNGLKPDLVVEMGLCLGHDIIFHQQLKIPHTVLIVKDRVFAHDPASFLTSHKGAAEKFLTGIDDSFRMKSTNWLEEIILSGAKITILDVREEKTYSRAHITGSINIPLRELPIRRGELNKEAPIICLCNGAIQSAYAVMFLSMKGFGEVYNLSGGFSKWERDHQNLTETLAQ